MQIADQSDQEGGGCPICGRPLTFEGTDGSSISEEDYMSTPVTRGVFHVPTCALCGNLEAYFEATDPEEPASFNPLDLVPGSSSKPQPD